MITQENQEPFEGNISSLQKDITECCRCPRLVEWRERIAREKVKRFQNDEYWGKPVPSLGNAEARLFIIGLAPAAHGGNRTGRIFTGDRSGDWLYRALYRSGFANQPTSVHRNDGLELIDCYITAMAHCAPPDNKPLPEEFHNCSPFLLREIEYLQEVHVVVALGQLAFNAALKAFAYSGKSKPKFSHGMEVELSEGVQLIASYHPSQRNTFTGTLTEEMFDAIFIRAREIIAGS